MKSELSVESQHIFQKENLKEYTWHGLRRDVFFVIIEYPVEQTFSPAGQLVFRGPAELPKGPNNCNRGFL